MRIYCCLAVKQQIAFRKLYLHERKWNESGFRPPLCTYRLNWARRTSWGWWDDWDDTVLQTQDLKFEPWRSEAEHATSRSRRLPTILTFTRGWGRNIFVSFKPPRPLSWACGHGTEMLLILKNIFLTWLLPDIFRYDSPKKCPTILYAVNLWLKPVSATGAIGDLPQAVRKTWKHGYTGTWLPFGDTSKVCMTLHISDTNFLIETLKQHRITVSCWPFL